jgi:CRISPR-associated protein Csb3
MARASIPVDLFNPGHVFACLGLVEAADILAGQARGAFEWRNAGTSEFHLSASGSESPVRLVLAFLAQASVEAAVPFGSSLSTAKWNLPTAVLDRGGPYPFPEPPAPATLPARLHAGGASLFVDHWGEAVSATGRDAVKFWAGLGGTPGARLMSDALALVKDRLATGADDPFSIAVPQSSSFRFDWRRDYIPIDVGFSPNDHGRSITMLGYPVVEILAAVGLSNARPLRLEKLAYRYAVAAAADGNELLDPLFLRAILGAAELPFPSRRFVMHLGWPGQEEQARCITNVIEEP